MKKKISLGIVLFFVLHFVTWVIFGKRALIKEQIMDAESDPYCFSQDSIWVQWQGASVSIFRDYDSEETRIYKVQDIEYKVYGAEGDGTQQYFDDTTTVVVERQLLATNSNPYLIGYGYACQEWYWGCGTGQDYHEQIATWFFVGWIKIMDLETLMYIVDSEYREQEKARKAALEKYRLTNPD